MYPYSFLHLVESVIVALALNILKLIHLRRLAGLCQTMGRGLGYLALRYRLYLLRVVEVAEHSKETFS